jgi:hypothetical protein
MLERASVDEVRRWLRQRSSDAARRLDLRLLDDAGEVVDRALVRVLTTARRLQRQAEELLERPEDLQARQRRALPPAVVDRSSPPSPGAATPAAAGSTELDVQASKFDLDRTHEAVEEPRELPWAYGRDRVTAIFVDADRLYAYWEATDPSIEQARQRLGSGGPTAWLNLRVYDVSGRLFDGTNAHSYFDQGIDRGDRQWFFEIGRPGSSVVVEFGLKSHEGYFVKIARSGRIDFPRREPAPAGDVEWLTVRPGTLEVGEPYTEERGARAPAEARGSSPLPSRAEGGEANGNGANHSAVLLPGHEVARRWEWQVVFPGDWWEIRRTLHWEGPVIRTSWEAGPFFVPVELPSRVEEYHTGDAQVLVQDGVTRLIYGPWQVVIRGIDARGQRRLLATWVMHRSWPAELGHASRSEWRRVQEGIGGIAEGTTLPGASERVTLGASESILLGASEMWLGGASEVYLLGASEIRFGGASETLFAAASEWRLRGASEVLLSGASELRLRGASEIRLGGASERTVPGASELRLGGGSELLVGGASERGLRPASED